MEELQGLRCGRMGSGAGDVRGALLGEKPRYARDRDFDILHVRIELSIDFRRGVVNALCTSTLRAFRPLRRLRFDAVGMRVSSADTRPAASRGCASIRTRAHSFRSFAARGRVRRGPVQEPLVLDR